MKTNSDYYSALAQIEALIEKGFENLTVEETELLSILSEEVEKFEATKYPMPLYSSI
jgi:antitoxin component HigA of HigAB toxin-antitoxin module